MNLRTLRILLWILVVVALAGVTLLLLRAPNGNGAATVRTTSVSFGGPFTLTGGDGKQFSSSRLNGRPHAIFFGFTNCGDVCPTTLGRLAKLRRELGEGDQSFDILFITIDPKRDGPKEVGQYATLFNTPIIGLTGSPAQIDQVKKQYGIHAEPSPHPTPGKEMVHTGTVLLFDGEGRFVATIGSHEPDSAALAKIRGVVA